MAVTESKKAIVAQMKETLSEAKGAVLIGYSGLTVAQATDLRRKMLAEGVEYKSNQKYFDSYRCKRIES